MSQSSDILSAGFDVIATEYPSTITKGAITKACVGSDVEEMREMMEPGYEVQFDRAVELTVANFNLLGIIDRDQVTCDSKAYIVVLIRKEDADPCVRLGLRNIK